MALSHLLHKWKGTIPPLCTLTFLPAIYLGAFSLSIIKGFFFFFGCIIIHSTHPLLITPSILARPFLLILV